MAPRIEPLKEAPFHLRRNQSPNFNFNQWHPAHRHNSQEDNTKSPFSSHLPPAASRYDPTAISGFYPDLVVGLAIQAVQIAAMAERPVLSTL